MAASLKETAPDILALEFANAVVAGEYEHARSLLSASLQEAITAEQLAEDFRQMIDYAECPPDHLPEVEVIMIDGVGVMEEWPAKQDDDLGWVYVALANDYYCEAVTVIVMREQGRSVIRDIEWGRP